MTRPLAGLTGFPAVAIMYLHGYTRDVHMKAEKGGERVDLVVSKWGNSLAVRLPAESARRLGVGEGDTLVGEMGPDGRLILSAEARVIGPTDVRRLRAFLARQKVTAPVVADLRRSARY